MSTFTITSNTEKGESSMRLFGMPYQFPAQVDPRYSELSSTIGRQYYTNIIKEAPILTLIPGKPKYLSKKDVETKKNTTEALVEAASGTFDSLKQLISDNDIDNMKLYDFERDYTEYMKYVNILCRAGASFLDIDETILIGTEEYSFQKFDWKNYRYSNSASNSVVGQVKNGVSAINSLFNEVTLPTEPDYSKMSKKKAKKAKAKYEKELKAAKKKNNQALKSKGITKAQLEQYTDLKSKYFAIDTDDEDNEDTLDEALTNYNYVQFYINPDSGTTDSMGNATGESSLKSLFSNGESTMKDLAFMMDSGGITSDSLNELTNGATSAIQSGVESLLGNVSSSSAGGLLSRIISLSGRVINGENIVIPDIYQSSSYSKSYTVNINLVSPYGDKFGYYINIFVPLMHLLALVMPKQGSANSYASPFLVKGYIEGQWTINLGIITDMSINKNAESLSADGLPMSVDVSMTIQDLYSGISMTPSNKPLLFLNNSSLIEFLATTCGLSLTKANLQTKYKNVINTFFTSVTDIPSTVSASVQESIMNAISSFTSLY